MRIALYFTFLLNLLLSISYPVTASDVMYWSVQSTTIKVLYRENGKLMEKFHDEYYLYYGNQYTLQREKTMSGKRIFSCFYLIHPGRAGCFWC